MGELLETNIRLLISTSCLTYAIIFIQNSSRFSPARLFGFAEASLGVWYMFSSLQLQISDVYVVILLRSLIYIASEFACVSVLLYCFLSTSITAGIHRNHILAAYLIPIASTAATLFSFIFFNKNPYIVIPDAGYLETISFPYRDYMFRKTPLYFIHCTYSYILLSLTIVIFIRNIIINPKENKRIILLTTIGIIVFFIPNFYRVYIENFKHENLSTASPFLELLSFLFMCTISFIAVFFDKNERNINICKTRFYEFAGLPIFLFTENMKFLQSNSLGAEFLKKYNINVKKFDDFEKIFPHSRLNILGLPNTPSSDTEFYISTETDKELYYGKKQETKNRFNKTLGYFVFLSKLDFYFDIIKQLEKSAYTDELTECRKRSIFIQHLNSELQKKTEMQLVFTASADNIETLNKTIGIKQTDSYIKFFSDMLKEVVNSFADSLSQSYQKNIEIFKMNGACFTFILPPIYEKEIPELFKKIRNECSKFSRNRPEPLVCSLGYSVSNGQTADADKTIQKSYNNMLLDRKTHADTAAEAKPQ